MQNMPAIASRNGISFFLIMILIKMFSLPKLELTEPINLKIGELYSYKINEIAGLTP